MHDSRQASSETARLLSVLSGRPNTTGINNKHTADGCASTHLHMQDSRQACSAPAAVRLLCVCGAGPTPQASKNVHTAGRAHAYAGSAVLAVAWGASAAQLG